jgi:hypothetical protein
MQLFETCKHTASQGNRMLRSAAHQDLPARLAASLLAQPACRVLPIRVVLQGALAAGSLCKSWLGRAAAASPQHGATANTKKDRSAAHSIQHGALGTALQCWLNVQQPQMPTKWMIFPPHPLAPAADVLAMAQLAGQHC